jgi:hypothetical protein
VTKPPADLIDLLATGHRQILEGLNEIEFILAEPTRQWLGNKLDTIRLAARSRVAEIELTWRSLRFDIVSRTGKDKDATLAALEGIEERVGLLRDEAAAAVQKGLDLLVTIDDGGLGHLASDSFRRVIRGIISVANTWEEFVAARDRAVKLFTAQLADNLDGHLANLVESVRAKASDIYAEFFPEKAALLATLQNSASARAVDAVIAELKKIKALENNHVRGELERMYDTLRRDLDEFVSRLGTLLRLPDLTGAPIGLNTLRLLRAFGEPPRVPQLDFRLPDCGYYFFDLPGGIDLKAVQVSALAARANQLAKDVRDGLNAIEITLPTVDLLDRLKPDNLAKYDLSRLFPNFAGLKLDSLFSTLRVPSLANDRVRVTHGVDPQSRSGWVQLDVDVPVTEPADVFSVAGSRSVC